MVIAEDEQEISSLLEVMLSSDFSIQIVANKSQFDHHLNQEPSADIYMLDYHCGDFKIQPQDIEALRKKKHTPIIISSGSARGIGDNIFDSLFAYPNVTFLQKPASYAQVVQTLKSIGMYKMS